MKKALIVSLVLVPFIGFQWYAKISWLRIDYSGFIFSYIHLLSVLYILAYYMIYKGLRKTGLTLAWVIFLILTIFHNAYNYRIDPYSIIISVDLWVNLCLTFIFLKPRITHKIDDLTK